VKITVSEAARTLEKRGALRRARIDQSAQVIEYVAKLVGRPLPEDLADFYREHIDRMGDFRTTTPVWNEHVGWLTRNSVIDWLLAANAIPIFDDGCGNLFGVDVSRVTDEPAVYFFDHEKEFKYPSYAVGSSIGAFLLLLAERDTAIDEKRAPGWELGIDPDLDKCPRAPPIWVADQLPPL
jgi:hypothetical protein